MPYHIALARISPRYRTRKPGRLRFWSMSFYTPGRFHLSALEG